MEIESIFLDSKWKILNELSQNNLSPSELAEKTKTSIANISSQIRLLEALDFIEMEKTNNISKGEPRKIYSLKKEFAYLILGTKFYVGKKMFKLDDKLMALFLSSMLNKKELSYALIKLILELDFNSIESLAFVDYNPNENIIEVLIISNKDGVFDYLNNNFKLISENIEYKVKVNILKKNDFDIFDKISTFDSKDNLKDNLFEYLKNSVFDKKEILDILKKCFILYDKGILKKTKIILKEV